MILLTLTFMKYKMILTIIIIVLLIISIKLNIDGKNQRELDRLEMVDFEIKFEKFSSNYYFIRFCSGNFLVTFIK